MPIARRRHRICRANVREHPYAALATLWTLRILLDLNGWQELGQGFRGNFTSNGAILRALDLGELEDQPLDADEFLRLLKQRQAELSAAPPAIGGALQENLQRLGAVLNLSETEQTLLAFAVVQVTHKGLAEAGDTLGELTNDTMRRALATILDLPVAAVRQALSPQGLLVRSGVLRYSKRGGAMPLQHKLEPLEGLFDVLLDAHANVLEMLHEYFQPARAPELLAEDFDFLGDQYRLLRNYLRQARSEGMTGVNLLIHGAPGTGKSELARLIAKELGLELYEIGMADADGDAVNGDRRFAAYQLSQQVLARQANALILFDEIEDVFHEPVIPFFGRIGRGDRRKAWTNHLLEENPVPALWISNDIRQIDPAFIRRFDIVLPLENPPQRVRQRILQRNLAKLPVSGRWIEQVAENSAIAPALVNRAARVVATIQRANQEPNQIPSDGADLERDLARLLGNTLRAMGHGDARLARAENLVPYRLDALHADRDLQQLLSGLQRRPQARICLYGPPGTGKSEFGRHTAKALDKPLLVRRASDLLDPYLGMTERHIARMFDQARNDDAVLLLDEADSFLRNRGGAQRSWEVTQVNELLTQMESFDGLFICSTNLMESLDDASLRRFDFKIRFDYLRPEQSWTLFRQTLADQGRPVRRREPWQSRLARLDRLTPGDFGTVLRARRFAEGALTPQELLQGLEQECAVKGERMGRGIGFTAAL